MHNRLTLLTGNYLKFLLISIIGLAVKKIFADKTYLVFQIHKDEDSDFNEDIMKLEKSYLYWKKKILK